MTTATTRVLAINPTTPRRLIVILRYVMLCPLLVPNLRRRLRLHIDPVLALLVLLLSLQLLFVDLPFLLCLLLDLLEDGLLVLSLGDATAEGRGHGAHHAEVGGGGVVLGALGGLVIRLIPACLWLVYQVKPLSVVGLMADGASAIVLYSGGWLLYFFVL